MKSGNGKKWLKRLVWLVLGGWLLLALVLFGGGVFLQTPVGRRLVEDSLNRWLDGDYGAVVVAGLHGRVPFDARFDRVRLEDREGEWAELRNVRIHWSWSELVFRRSIHIFELSVESVLWERIPAGEERESEREAWTWTEPAWRWGLPPLRVERLLVGRCWLPQNLIGDQAVIALQAEVTADEHALTVERGLLRRLDGDGGELAFHLAIARKRDWLMAATGAMVVPEEYLPEFIRAYYGGETLAGDLRLKLKPVDKVLSGQLHLALAGVDLRGVGTLGLEQRQIEGGMELVVGELEPLLANFGVSSSDSLYLLVTAEGALDLPRIRLGLELGELISPAVSCQQVSMTGALDFMYVEQAWRVEADLSSTFTGLQALDYPRLPSEVELAIKSKYDFGTRLRVEEAVLSGGSIKAEGAGEVDFNSLLFDCELAMEVVDLPNWLPPAEWREGWAGDLDLRAELQGDIRRGMYFASTEWSLPGLDLALPALGEAVGDRPRASGKWRLVTGDRLSVTDFNLELAVGELSGGGDYLFEAGELSVDTSLRVDDLAWLGGLLGTELQGRAALSAKVEGPVASSAWQVVLTGSDLTCNELSPVNLRAAADFARIGERWGGELTAGVQYRDEQLDASCAFDWSNARLTFDDIMVRGLQARLAGTTQWNTAAGLLEGRLKAEAEDISRLGAWLNLTPAPAGEIECEIELSSQDDRQQAQVKAVGRSQAWGDWSVEESALTISADDLFRQQAGRAEISIARAGAGSLTIDRGILKVEFVSDALEFESTFAGRIAEDVNGALAGYYRRDHERHEFELSQMQGEFAGGSFALVGPLRIWHKDETTVLSPVRLSLGPATLMAEGRREGGNVNGRLQIDEIDLSDLEMALQAGVLLPPEHSLQGVVSLDLTMAGSLPMPEVTGQFRLSQGVYEHLNSGIYLTDIDMRAWPVADGSFNFEFSAGDGRAGLLDGGGNLQWEAGEGFSWRVESELGDFRLLRHRLGTVDIASASVVAEGNRERANLRGNLSFQQIEADVPEGRPSEVAGLPVVEIGREQVVQPADAAAAGRLDYSLHLDLDLELPARGYLRGRGLDSEWRGRLQVGGTGAEPQLRGRLELVRGRLRLLGRNFRLARESFVAFDGSVPPDPQFDVRGSYRRRGRQIEVRVIGTAATLDFELASDPPMPPDEILAWLLFGRSVATLTPLQAVQLANAAATLARGGTGPDVMGRLRSMIGLDELGIVLDQDGAPRVGAGRYVHERVYLRARTGLAPGSDEFGVEVELTPRLILESGIGINREGGVGIFWRHNY